MKLKIKNKKVSFLFLSLLPFNNLILKRVYNLKIKKKNIQFVLAMI